MKKIIAVLLSLVLAFSMVACGGGSPKTNTCKSCSRTYEAGDSAGNFKSIAKSGMCNRKGKSAYFVCKPRGRLLAYGKYYQNRNRYNRFVGMREFTRRNYNTARSDGNYRFFGVFKKRCYLHGRGFALRINVTLWQRLRDGACLAFWR